MSTYREEIQTMIDQLENIYDRTHWLRDQATIEEKVYWDMFKGRLAEVVRPLQVLDKGLTDARARTTL